MLIRYLRSSDAKSADALSWLNDSKQNDVEEVDDGGSAVKSFPEVEHDLKVVEWIDAVPNRRCRIHGGSRVPL